MLVIKSDGTKERFDKKKIIRTCIRARVDEKTAREIADYIEDHIKEGFSTGMIFRMIVKELEKRKHNSAFLIGLRDSVSEIDPESFELFIKKILEYLGYSVEWNKIIAGKCVEHQVDLIAEKDEKKTLVECKHHNNPHRFCGLEVCLQVQARLEDILDGFKEKRNRYNFSQAWIFTNSKFSQHAKRYAEGKSILLTGWRYRGSMSLESLVETNKLYPITVLQIDPRTRKQLFDRNIIIMQDVLKNESKLSKLGLKNIVEQTRKLLKS